MKKCWILVLAFLLVGCSKQMPLETLGDTYVQPVMAEQWQLVMDIPLDAGVQVMESEEAGKLYFCEDYLVAVQTVASGDLSKTFRLVTGYEKDRLEILQTQKDGRKRYECVFVSTGEGETLVGRACVLDDGNYHYVITAMAGESVSGELVDEWNNLFASIRLVEPDAELNSGS